MINDDIIDISNIMNNDLNQYYLYFSRNLTHDLFAEKIAIKVFDSLKTNSKQDLLDIY